MNTKLIKLANSAADLVKQKEKLRPSDYNKGMESIVNDLAIASSKLQSSLGKDEVDLVEKMSFEIRTPMNSILGFTGLLKDNYFSLEEKNEFIDLIEANTQQLVQLLNDLTDLTRIENLQLEIRKEEFELNVFILNLMSDFSSLIKDRNVSLSKFMGQGIKDDICITTDPYQLRHILDNLLMSIINYSENTQVLFSVDIENKDTLCMKILSNNVELPETISSSIKRHISYTAKENTFDGTGLRLTLTKALVDLLDGVIKFNCEPGKGSSFTLKIPITLCAIKR